MAEASSTPGRSNGVLPGTPLLATKLYVPPARTNLLPRPRLLGRLDQALTSRLTLISGPAGFGKTTFTSLSDNAVYSIYQDRSGELWIGTLSGLDRLDQTTIIL